MWNWLHHIITPHCETCEYDKHYLQEKLSLLLEQERAEKFRLLELLAPSRNSSARSDTVDISQMRRNPRSVMRDLERNSAKEAEVIRRRRPTEEIIEELEEEAGVAENG